VYKILTASITAGAIRLILSTVDGLEVGACIRIYNTGEQRIDRRTQIATIDPDTNTINSTAVAGPAITAFDPPNASLVPLTTWVDDDDVALFLGFEIVPESADADYLAECVEAANEWAYLRRRNAGYDDSRCIIPSPAVKQGTVLYAGALFREKGSVDSFQSYQEMSLTPVGGMGQVLRLLGLQRPTVA
jgi:hypothetical protein